MMVRLVFPKICYSFPDPAREEPVDNVAGRAPSLQCLLSPFADEIEVCADVHEIDHYPDHVPDDHRPRSN